MPYKRTDESGRRFLCEVHWALSFPRPNIISLPNIWKTAHTERISDMNVLCLSCEDMFFSLILHLRRYYIPLSLRYICDISRLIRLYKDKINWEFNPTILTVTMGQLNYEIAHLLNKLKVRDTKRYKELVGIKNFDPHPLFKVVEGEIEKWEIIEKNNTTHNTEHIYQREI